MTLQPLWSKGVIVKMQRFLIGRSVGRCCSFECSPAGKDDSLKNSPLTAETLEATGGAIQDFPIVSPRAVFLTKGWAAPPASMAETVLMA